LVVLKDGLRWEELVKLVKEQQKDNLTYTNKNISLIGKFNCMENQWEFMATAETIKELLSAASVSGTHYHRIL